MAILTNPIESGDTVLGLDASIGSANQRDPSTYFHAQLDSEIILVYDTAPGTWKTFGAISP